MLWTAQDDFAAHFYRENGCTASPHGNGPSTRVEASRVSWTLEMCPSEARSFSNAFGSACLSAKQSETFFMESWTYETLEMTNPRPLGSP